MGVFRDILRVNEGFINSLVFYLCIFQPILSFAESDVRSESELAAQTVTQRLKQPASNINLINRLKEELIERRDGKILYLFMDLCLNVVEYFNRQFADVKYLKWCNISITKSILVIINKLLEFLIFIQVKLLFLVFKPIYGAIKLYVRAKRAIFHDFGKEAVFKPPTNYNDRKNNTIYENIDKKNIGFKLNRSYSNIYSEDDGGVICMNDNLIIETDPNETTDGGCSIIDSGIVIGAGASGRCRDIDNISNETNSSSSVNSAYTSDRNRNCSNGGCNNDNSGQKHFDERFYRDYYDDGGYTDYCESGTKVFVSDNYKNVLSRQSDAHTQSSEDPEASGDWNATCDPKRNLYGAYYWDVRLSGDFGARSGSDSRRSTESETAAASAAKNTTLLSDGPGGRCGQLIGCNSTRAGRTASAYNGPKHKARSTYIEYTVGVNGVCAADSHAECVDTHEQANELDLGSPVNNGSAKLGAEAANSTDRSQEEADSAPLDCIYNDSETVGAGGIECQGTREPPSDHNNDNSAGQHDAIDCNGLSAATRVADRLTPSGAGKCVGGQPQQELRSRRPGKKQRLEPQHEAPVHKGRPGGLLAGHRAGAGPGRAPPRAGGGAGGGCCARSDPGGVAATGIARFLAGSLDDAFVWGSDQEDDIVFECGSSSPSRGEFISGTNNHCDKRFDDTNNVDNTNHADDPLNYTTHSNNNTNHTYQPSNNTNQTHTHNTDKKNRTLVRARTHALQLGAAGRLKQPRKARRPQRHAHSEPGCDYDIEFFDTAARCRAPPESEECETTTASDAEGNDPGGSFYVDFYRNFYASREGPPVCEEEPARRDPAEARRRFRRAVHCVRYIHHKDSRNLEGALVSIYRPEGSKRPKSEAPKVRFLEVGPDTISIIDTSNRVIRSMSF